MVGREAEVLGGSVGSVMRVGSPLVGWSRVPCVLAGGAADSMADRSIKLWRRGISCSAAEM